MLEQHLGTSLDPAVTDVFLCGNPAMIGLPLIDSQGVAKYPVTVGACQLLTERGFVVERRGTLGNIHYEEYW